MNSDRQANLIKVAAVITAAPRWVAALIVSEGLTMPVEWLGWWRVVSFVMAGTMAFVEAFAFSYILRAWREARADSPQAKRLMWLIILSALCFIAVMAPNIYASVQGVALAGVLAGVPLAVWSVAVAASTILIVGSVGYAQRRAPEQSKSSTKAEAKQTGAEQAGAAKQVQAEQAESSYTCPTCGKDFGSGQARGAHYMHYPEHKLQPSKNGRKDAETVERAQGGEA